MTKQVSLEDHLVQLARISLKGEPENIRAAIRQLSKRLKGTDGSLAVDLAQLLASHQDSHTRDFNSSRAPHDSDSKLPLARVDTHLKEAAEPILPDSLKGKLNAVLAEQCALGELQKASVEPTRSLLFVGPPGVGKTMTAKWLAYRSGRPLVTLDLASVMSSYLGQTGSNIKTVLEYAKSSNCVLLLDEFDAIAKRRNDESDVGELKRLVTVLLQEIDEWPTSSLLIAATNHGELLDPAIWRRFDDVLPFEIPGATESRALILDLLAGQEKFQEKYLDALTALWEGVSMSDIKRDIMWAKRNSIVMREDFTKCLLERVTDLHDIDDINARKKIAKKLISSGISDRKVSLLVGISRDTLRKDRRRAAEGKDLHE